MIAALYWLAGAAIASGVIVTLFRGPWRRGLGLQAAGAAVLILAGFGTLATGHAVGAAFTSQLTPRLGVDRLSGVFLATLGLVAAPALAYSSRYLDGSRRGRLVGALTGVFVLAMASLLCARDPITFLGSWELMSLLPAVIILLHRDADAEARRSVFIYVAITHLGGVGTWVAVLLLAHAGALGTAGVVGPGSGLQIGIALAALVGMGTKAGLVPLHAWLPRAHPMAPAPVSALMSGVMIKLAVYSMIRVFVDWLGVLPTWFGVLVLAVGALSSVGGVTYALFQHELKRLLALHSIENIGIIVLGLGACLVLRAHGEDVWAAFALAAALLHTVNHAVFKALLFLCAGSIERSVGSLELNRLGGLLRRMPWTGGAFFVGAMAIAGLPPLNGFASEWLTLQALLHVVMSGHVGDGTAGAVALAALGATAALAVFCFVKVVGLVLLGPPRQGTRARCARGRGTDARSGYCARRRVHRAGARAGSVGEPARRGRSLVERHTSPCRSLCAGYRVVADGRDRCDPRRGDSGADRAAWSTYRRVLRRRGCAGSRLCPSSSGRAQASPSRCGWCSRLCCDRAGKLMCARTEASSRRSRMRARCPT